jgi:hypothetical protein
MGYRGEAKNEVPTPAGKRTVLSALISELSLFNVFII